jgi:hypothetical protein
MTQILGLLPHSIRWPQRSTSHKDLIKPPSCGNAASLRIFYESFSRSLCAAVFNSYGDDCETRFQGSSGNNLAIYEKRGSALLVHRTERQSRCQSKKYPRNNWQNSSTTTTRRSHQISGARVIPNRKHGSEWREKKKSLDSSGAACTAGIVHRGKGEARLATLFRQARRSGVGLLMIDVIRNVIRNFHVERVRANQITA